MYTVSAGLMLSGAWVAPGVMGAEYPFEDPLLAFEVHERAEPLVLAVALLAAFVLLGKSYSRSTSVLHRSQMRWVMWGLGLGLSPSVLLQAVPWALGAPELPGWARLITVAPAARATATEPSVQPSSMTRTSSTTSRGTRLTTWPILASSS